MRVAVHATGEIGRRVIRILQAEPAISAVSAWGVDQPIARAPLTDDLDGFDVVVTDANNQDQITTACLAASASLVTGTDWDRESDRPFTEAGLSLVAGANLRSGLAASLALQEAALMDEPLEVRLAWTEPGRPYRRGEPIPFPDPVGSLWARETKLVGWDPRATPATAFEARVEGVWAAAMAQVSGALDDGVQRTIVGAADDAAYLTAIALAAPVAPVGQNVYQPGYQWASAAPTAYLDRALAAGLDVASFHETSAS